MTLARLTKNMDEAIKKRTWKTASKRNHSKGFWRNSLFIRCSNHQQIKFLKSKFWTIFLGYKLQIFLTYKKRYVNITLLNSLNVGTRCFISGFPFNKNFYFHFKESSRNLSSNINRTWGNWLNSIPPEIIRILMVF